MSDEEQEYVDSIKVGEKFELNGNLWLKIGHGQYAFVFTEFEYINDTKH